MKMSKEHYEHMKTEISRALPTFGYTLKDYTNAGMSSKRYAWDLVHSANLTPWLCNTLYKAGLNDDHIDTALRKILVDLALV